MDLRANILLTFFEPFGESATNISQQVAEGIDTEGVVKLCLPVSFQRSPHELREAIERYQPGIILSLGQCAEGEKIRLERFAINMMDSVKGDNDGYMPDEQPIEDNTPLTLRTGVNIKQLHSECMNAGLPTVLSNSSGLYVCNRVYWEALRYTDKALFVHIPKNMNLKPVRNTINFLVKQIKLL